MEEMMAMGEEVYLASCAACHQASGKGLPPAFPGLDGSAIALGDIATHLDMVINGSAKNPAMAAFSSQLTKTQIAAVVTYERNAWGNKTGDLIQAADVSAASAK
jgi:cytochrome c oxidase subunit 2